MVGDFSPFFGAQTGARKEDFVHVALSARFNNILPWHALGPCTQSLNRKRTDLTLGNAPLLSDLFVLVFVLQILCVSHGLAHNGRESESEWMGSSGYDLPAAAVSCSEEIQV